MSDMQKGLIDAVNSVLPKSHHRWCVRHIEANHSKNWRSIQMKKLMWWCAWSTYEDEFNDQLTSFGTVSEKAAKELISYLPQKWCRAYFDTKSTNEMVDNNFTESFNKWILEARHKPIIKMLEEIRVKVMKLLKDREEECRNWSDEISPYAKELLTDYRDIAQGPKSKRKREKGEARKREGAWSSSRKELLMTCGYCSNRGHNLRTCPLVNKKMNVDAGSSQEVQDVPLTALQESQTSEQVQQSVNDEWEGEEEDEDEDGEPILRLKVISESKIRLRQKKLQRLSIGIRKINFKGDEFGVVEPTNLPYSPKKFT